MTHSTHRSKAAQINPKKGFRIHLLVYLLVAPAIWLVWSLTDKSYPWPLWSTGGWTIGIIFHYLGVYIFRKNLNNNKN